MGWSGPMTWRQYRAWEQWSEDELNRPGLTETYLMQLSLQVARIFARNPRALELHDFRLRFGDDRSSSAGAPTVNPDTVTQLMRARWAAIVSHSGPRPMAPVGLGSYGSGKDSPDGEHPNGH